MSEPHISPQSKQWILQQIQSGHQVDPGPSQILLCSILFVHIFVPIILFLMYRMWLHSHSFLFLILLFLLSARLTPLYFFLCIVYGSTLPHSYYLLSCFSARLTPEDRTWFYWHQQQTGKGAPPPYAAPYPQQQPQYAPQGQPQYAPQGPPPQYAPAPQYQQGFTNDNNNNQPYLIHNNNSYTLNTNLILTLFQCTAPPGYQPPGYAPGAPPQPQVIYQQAPQPQGSIPYFP